MKFLDKETGTLVYIYSDHSILECYNLFSGVELSMRSFFVIIIIIIGERIGTLFKEQGITIVSILTAMGMTLGVLIEALLGGPSTSTPTSQSVTTSDKKGRAREWIKNKLKALSQLLGKLADKALASLPGIIGSILSWILNRAKEVVGWLSQNLWALITGVGVLIYTYFMTKTNRR